MCQCPGEQLLMAAHLLFSNGATELRAGVLLGYAGRTWTAQLVCQTPEAAAQPGDCSTGSGSELALCARSTASQARRPARCSASPWPTAALPWVLPAAGEKLPLSRQSSSNGCAIPSGLYPHLT